MHRVGDLVIAVGQGHTLITPGTLCRVESHFSIISAPNSKFYALRSISDRELVAPMVAAFNIRAATPLDIIDLRVDDV